jgi:hypothetical protein
MSRLRSRKARGLKYQLIDVLFPDSYRVELIERG